MPSLKKTLDRFYREYDFNNRLTLDPIQFPRRYSNPDDSEVAAFIASCFAYGQVGVFKTVIEKVLHHGKSHPAKFFAELSYKKDFKYFRGIRYRFNKEKDVLCLIYMVHQVLIQWGSLRKLFYHYYKPEHDDIREGLQGFVDFFLNLDTSPVYGENRKPYGLVQLFPSPGKGSACKRMNLFLRWMVRKEDIDLGIWDRVPPSKLIIPLDTHIARISRCLGFTHRLSSDWKTAQEVTAALKKMDPRDPLKYDFALCHHGISGLCKGKKFTSVCSSCFFF